MAALRAHRFAHHDPNDPNARALAIDGGVLELEGWRAGGLAGWLAPRKKRWGGGPERPAKKAMEGSQKIFYFYANRAMLTV